MTQELLDVRGLTVRFGGLTALDDVAFTIAPREIVGIIGPNGAGKTTLFNALIRIQRPAAGSVRFAGAPIDGLKPHRVARLGMTKTFQNAALFPDMTVLENVLTAALSHHPLDAAARVAHQTLDRLDLKAIADVDVGVLTFPQKAMVELARALATEPKLLLLDEVMAALTPAEMDEVIAVIRSLRDEGLTFIVVEHHMRVLMALCDRLLFLNFGRLIADGAPDEIVAHPDVVKAYLGEKRTMGANGHA